MKLNTDSMVSIEEISNDFSKAAEVIETAGMAVVLKDNKPKYVILDFNQFVSEQKESGENIQDVASRVMNKSFSSSEEASPNRISDVKEYEQLATNRISDAKEYEQLSPNQITNLKELGQLSQNRTSYQDSASLDVVKEKITLEDIFNLNADYDTGEDGTYQFNDKLIQETILNFNDDSKNEVPKINNMRHNEPKAYDNNDVSEELKMNMESYSEDKAYIDDATKRTIEELKELLKG